MPAKELWVADAGSALAVTDHAAPFQRSISDFVDASVVYESPTAMQLVALVHDTPASALNVAEGALGLATIDQATPFQRSTSVLELVAGEPKYVPTAKQLVALVHETLSSRLLPVLVLLGLATIDHAVPFQRWMRVLIWPSSKLPTAKQFVALVHDTLLNRLEPVLDLLGLGTIDHVEPFQRSTRVLDRESPDVPTAKHVVALGHDTPARTLCAEPAGFGLGTVDQLVPFGRSTSVAVVPEWVV